MPENTFTDFYKFANASVTEMLLKGNSPKINSICDNSRL